MKRKRITRFFLLFSLLLSIIVLHAAYSIWSFASVRHWGKTDAALVLGAAVWDSQPSPVFRERIDHAIWLYQNGYVGGILFTGGKSADSPEAESEVARDYAIKHGVHPADILAEDRSTITEENLSYALEVARSANWHSFTIVSDPLHMKRSMAMAHDLGMEAYSSPTPTSAYQSLKTKAPFFLRELFYYLGYQANKPIRWLGLYR
ncbi:YdcF family protein [Brevibacillus borstelensis]|uniref:YdcF family protein n=1 Tax=Brevibacillus borstelensis TaxID=45462 RepID=UPI0030C6117E